MRRCRHGGETLKRARRLRGEGRFAAALDDYLAVLADHPVETTVCRRPILMETAWLAYVLDCADLAGACAKAAYQEAVLGRAEAPALLIMALVDARKGWGEQAEGHLAQARVGARWTLSQRRRIGLGAVVVGVYTDEEGGEFNGRAPRGGSRLERALARLAYASALRDGSRPDEAAEQFTMARTELERLRPIRRLRDRGRPVACRHLDALAELGWAAAVAERGPSDPDARLAAATLAARGATDRAMRLDADLGSEDRRNPSLCWYSDGALVKRWSELVGGVPDRSWLTPEDAGTLVSRLLDVFGRLRATDPGMFTPGDRLTARTLALYGDRMGYPSLALEASRAELRIARCDADTDPEFGWEQMAWVLRRQAICLGDVGITDGQIPLLAEAAELYRENDTGGAGRDEARLLGEKIVSLHLRKRDWPAATAATVAAQRRLAVMSGDDPLPAIAKALSPLHARALNDAPTGVARSIATERTEILRVLAERDPCAFACEYGDHLLAEVRSRPSDDAAVGEAIGLARRLRSEHRDQHVVLQVHILREVARTRLPDRPDQGLALLDEANSAGPLPKACATEEADAHWLRAACLRLLGREAERVDELLLEADAALGDGVRIPFRRFLAIEDVLWSAGRMDAALELVDKAIDAVADGGEAAGMLRLRRAERASELLRDAEALEELAVVSERHSLLAARCQAAYGQVHWRAQRREEAIAALDASLALEPGQLDTWQMRGAFRALLGDVAAALDDLHAAARLQPENWWTRAALSETHLLLRDDEAAVREGHLAVDLNPDQAAAHAAFGLSLMAFGDRGEAFDELDIAIALRRAQTNGAERTIALLSLPRLLVARGDPEAARRVMEEAIAALPAPYLVWEVVTELRQLAYILPETADTGASVLHLLGRDSQ